MNNLAWGFDKNKYGKGKGNGKGKKGKKGKGNEKGVWEDDDDSGEDLIGRDSWRNSGWFEVSQHGGESFTSAETIWHPKPNRAETIW